ncbi:hypothetical protein [Phycobacter sp. K97]|jgi:hypothetical protein|uniref:hypothetical protein n=1 Tax=Phycobacter sedimenti TaxID=3133977 RepID=UPI00311DC14D
MVHVLHISPSALAGAPGMLSEALSDFGHVESSVHFRAGDHGNQRDIFSPESIPVKDARADKALFMMHFKNADVVHVHNFIPNFVLKWMSEEKKRDCKYIFQVHSPRYERPVYDDLSDFHGIRFSEKLVISHFHPRHYPDFEIIPNCLYRKAFAKKPHVILSDALRIQFSPSGRSTGRWSAKSSQVFDQAIDFLKNDKRFEFAVFEGVSPQNLSHRRFLADVTIDELVTGSYHLVSYEGLAAGTVVLNNADTVSTDMFQIGFRSPPPPFLKCDPLGLHELLMELHRDREKLLELRTKSREFFDTWMSPDRISKMYADIYER